MYVAHRLGNYHYCYCYHYYRYDYCYLPPLALVILASLTPIPTPTTTLHLQPLHFTTPTQSMLDFPPVVRVELQPMPHEAHIRRPGEDWAGITNPKERKRLQNRLNKRVCTLKYSFFCFPLVFLSSVSPRVTLLIPGSA